MNTGPNKSPPQNDSSQNNFDRDRRFPSPPPLPRSAVAVSSEPDTMKPADLAARSGQAENPKPPSPVKARLESAEEKVVEAKEQGPTIPVTERLSENVAGMLCYLFGWVSGLIFLLIDRRPYVRFHAAQSVAVFATLNILLLALGGFFLGALIPGVGANVLLVLTRVVELGWLAAAVVLMLKAAGGERFHVKYASDFAERAAHGAK
jgi:uncharacterized membrane protein